MTAGFTAITSTHNPLIAAVRALHTPKGRTAAQLCLFEGPHLIQEMARAHLRPATVLFDPDAPGVAPLISTLTDWASDGVEVFATNAAVMERVTETHTTQGIVATLPLRELAADRLRTQRRGRNRPLVVILDAISDPVNVGTIL